VLLTATQPAATLLAGGALAADLARDLYYVDLRHVVSKYLGETEKNLDQVFAAAEKAHVVLLLDEADALFDKQSEVEDSHDRYANVEVSYLLERIEMFEGLAILATNSNRSTVAALLGRFAFVIDQPIV
jgi:SpoVK/Ycf46/Vps4 family AAA+-type ATPase